jgi:hypothetical protein
VTPESDVTSCVSITLVFKLVFLGVTSRVNSLLVIIYGPDMGSRHTNECIVLVCVPLSCPSPFV